MSAVMTRRWVIFTILIVFAFICAFIFKISINHFNSKKSFACNQLGVLSVVLLPDLKETVKKPLLESDYVLKIASTAKLIDPWGKSFIFSPEKKEIYSSGENGIDENGFGDDLTCRERVAEVMRLNQ